MRTCYRFELLPSFFFLTLRSLKISLTVKAGGHFPFDGLKYRLGVNASPGCMVSLCNWPPKHENEENTTSCDAGKRL